MASRFQVKEEFKLNYEVPYLSGKGELIGCTTVPVMEEHHGVSISYAMTSPSPSAMENSFPAEGVSSLAATARFILDELEVKPHRTILQLWEHTPHNRLFSVEGRAPVSAERDAVLLILTKTPFIYRYDYDLVLWHQAMHARDRWERRFLSSHPLVEIGEWFDALWHLSIDGRLEAMGKPHYSRLERLEEVRAVLRDTRPAGDHLAEATQLCDDLWGKETTHSRLIEIGLELSLAGVTVGEAGGSSQGLKKT